MNRKDIETIAKCFSSGKEIGHCSQCESCRTTINIIDSYVDALYFIRLMGEDAWRELGWTEIHYTMIRYIEGLPT